MKVQIKKGTLSQSELDVLVRNGAINLSWRRTSGRKVGEWLIYSLVILWMVLFMVARQTIALWANNDAYIVNTGSLDFIFEQEIETQEDLDAIVDSIDATMNNNDSFHQIVEKFDIDRFAYAVAMAETGNCTVWNSAERNNCFGIMQWDKYWNRWYKSYETKEDSYKDFKRIWSSYYWEYPTRAMAIKYTWNDRVDTWLDNVMYFYHNEN